jgi:hypothetical protein
MVRKALGACMHKLGRRGTLDDLPTVEPAITPDEIRTSFEEPPDEEVERAGTVGRQLYPLLVLLILALGALGIYLRLRTLSQRVANGAMLALQAEQQGPALRVSWNRDISVVNNASGGVLSIRDGDLQPKELHFDVEQLRNGSVVYSPANKRVEFRLEVKGQDGTKTDASVLTGVAPKALTASEVVASRRAVSSRSRISSSSGRAEMVGPPSQPASLSPQAFALIEQLAFVQPNLPAPAASPQNRTVTQEPQQPLAFPAFAAARPIHESLPNLPSEVRATVVSEVEIRVKVQVDESGRGVQVDLMEMTGPASNSVVDVTREAALQWRFAPAMRGNQPVASEVVLKFRYIPKISEN